MKFSSHLIYFIAFFAQLFVKESNETNANRKYKCHHQSNDRAESDFKNDDAVVTSQYKKYLNAPTKLGPDQFTNTLQEWFDTFQIHAAIWHFQKLSSELLEKAIQILNESNDVEQISEETPNNAKEAVVGGKPKMVFVHKIVEMVTEYARIETKCAKMKEGIEDSKRALCYHYNTLAKIVEGIDKWTTDKRATSKILVKRRVKKLIKILPVHSTEAKVPVESLCDSENDSDRIFSELINSDQTTINMLHAENVARMVKTSALFRDFLCDEPELSKIKLKLEELVGTVELMRLEEEFPEILRIDIVSQQTMLESYKQLLSRKFPIDQRNKMFLRKTMALMIGTLREMENRFKKPHSKNETLQQIVLEKLQIILNNSFDDLHSLKNICVMIKFVYFVQGKRTPKQLETELKTWKTKKCETAEEQQRMLDDYYVKELGKQYKNEIVLLLKSDKNSQILQLLAEIGAKSQLIKFIGPMFDELDASGLLYKIYPSNSFQNDENLWEHYAKTITNDKLSDLGMKSKLLADFFVFFRFLHQTLAVEQKMEIFWDRINKFFDIKFDVLLADDRKLEDIMNFQANLDIIFLKTKNFVLGEIVEKNVKKPSKYMQELLWSKWGKKIYKSSEKKATTNWRRIFALDEFMSKLHQKEITALFRHKYFVNKFQKVLSEYGVDKIKQIVNPIELGKDWEKIVEKIEQKKDEKKQFANITKTQNLSKKLEKTDSEKQEELKSECKNIEKPSFKQEMLDQITGDQMGKIEQFGCPDKGLTLQEMVAFEKTNFSVDEHLLMVSFLEYFTTDAADVQLNRRLKEQKQCLQVELDAFLWMYSNFLKIFKIDYINKEINSQNRKVEICTIYQSFEFVVKKQGLLLLGDDNSLLLFLKTFLYEEFCDKEEIRSVQAEDFASWLAPRCGDDEKVQRVLARLCSNRSKLEEITFIAFRNLLEKSLQFRAYFCNLSEKSTILEGKKSEEESNSNKNGWSADEFWSEFSATKGKLHELVGDNNLIKLEEKFPEVLKIGIQLLKILPALYKNILSHKSHTSKAKMWASRIAIPQIMQSIDIFLIEEIKNSTTVCAELQNVLNVKCQQIYRNALKTLAKREFFEWTGQSLCLLVQFEKLAKSTLALCSTAAKDRINLETVRKWWPNCTEYDAQLNAYQQQQKGIAKLHSGILFLIIKENEEFREFVRETPGVRRRIANLLASEEDYRELMTHCAEYIRKPTTEDRIELLYLKFLNTFDTLDVESKLANVLELSYAVWTRWMDGELRVENPRLPIGLRQIYEQIWRHCRELYENVYDKVYDESLDELMFRKKLIRQAFTEVGNFVESKRNEKNLEKLGLKTWKGKSDNRRMQTPNVNSDKLLDEWNTLWKSASLRIQMEEAQCQRNECQTKMERFEVEPSDWMQTQHFNMLTDLLEHKSMRVRLKNELKARPEIVEQWLLQFMCWEMAEKILHLIKLNDEQFAVMRAYQKENWTKKGENSEDNEEEEQQQKEETERIEEELEEKRKGMKKKEENGGQKKSPKEEKVMRKRKHSKSFLDTKNEKGKKTVNATTTTTSQFEMSDSAAVEQQRPSDGTENSEPSSLEASNFSEKFEQNSPNQTADDENDNDLKKALENLDLNDFLKGDYLMSKYQNILLDPNKLASQILDIGIYLYEISNRFKAADGMLKAISEFEKNEMQLIYSNQLDNLIQKWNKFRQHLVGITKVGNFNRKFLEKSLQIMLKEIISVAEGWNIETKTCSISQIDEEKDIKNVKMQLHRNNLANSITSKFGKCADIWAESSDERRMLLLLSLFQWDKKKKQNSKMVHKFLTDLNGWQKMLEQQRIDRLSTIQHNNYLLNSKFGTEKAVHTHYSFVFPQFNQQLFFVQFNDDAKHLTELNEIVIKKNYVKTDEANKALNELKIIMSKWSKEARMLETGSFMLGARTSNSDIDVICIVPQKLTKFEEQNQFFGTFECNLALRKCEQNSFYCLLCQHDKVELLKRMPLAFIPLIKLKFCGFEFDILFVSIPTIETLPSEPMTRSDVMGMMHKLAIQAEPDEKMIKSLAGYITNDHIMELLGNKIIQKFRKFIAILKLWAKSNYIYNTLFGFFNGISLTIMATKVLLFYPNASVPFLLHKFFFTYCTWEWPIPVRLADYVPNEFEKFSWTQKAEEDKKNSPLLMPIITPGCLEQNGMYNMSKSTYQIVQTSMQEALIKVRQVPSDWRQLFPMKKFTEKYEHFVAICCIVGNHIHLDKFCGFVERRIRLQLEHFDDMTSEVKFSHILTEDNGKLNCPNSILTHSKSEFKNLSLHKVWLVGIELADKSQNGDSEEAKAYLKSKINTKLSEEFDKKILNYFLKGSYQPVLLISNYVDASELELDDSFV